jgi:hypothetical protein
VASGERDTAGRLDMKRMGMDVKRLARLMIVCREMLSVRVSTRPRLPSFFCQSEMWMSVGAYLVPFVYANLNFVIQLLGLP